VLFANLFSVGAYHPVIALARAHFLWLSEFTPRMIADGFKAAHEFVRAVRHRDPSPGFTALCANYLFPAGASMVHPHMQLLVTPAAYSYHARILNASRRYGEEHGSSCFDDLVREEKKIGERFIARQNRWNWIAAFSPMGSNEITAIHEQESDFAALSEEDLDTLSQGITKILLFYERLGHLSFNYALYSVREKDRTEEFRCVFKIISRQNLYPNYRNDDYFLQKMLQSELIFNLPEELAGQLRRIF
jgi:galactose-1-phosphate uridylyltransferase